ncbi:MAG: hypothetical protein R3C14_34175 [Caldilineaceae bacterium]
MMMPDYATIRERMKATGIGFAGIEGAWWLPATEPFVLPTQVERDLHAIAAAIFLLFDVVTELYGTTAGAAAGLNALLEHKVPSHLLGLVSSGRVEGVRPDFQLVVEHHATDPRARRYRLMATELEICPSAHGFAHAMQVGYGLPPDLVQGFADYLAGRELLFVGTAQWSEFLLEQLAFCRALAEVGARGRVLYDLPQATLTAEIEQRQRWQPPIFGVNAKTPAWEEGISRRLAQHRLAPYWDNGTQWPTDVGNAVLFRFGYLDCFAPNHLQYFQAWQEAGATWLNPAHFILDSKVILAALQLPAIRARIALQSAQALQVLDRTIPATRLLTTATLAELLAQRPAWVVKFAGYDQQQQAWGGRSVQIGADHTDVSWQSMLEKYLVAPCPVVAQRLAPSLQSDIAFFDSNHAEHWLQQGHTRLRVFFLRHAKADAQHDVEGRPVLRSTIVAGAHLTVAGGSKQVSEATDAVQAPVLFLA